MPVRATGPAHIIGMNIIATGPEILATGLPVLVTATVGHLGLLHSIWARLNRQVTHGRPRMLLPWAHLEMLLRARVAGLWMKLRARLISLRRAIFRARLIALLRPILRALRIALPTLRSALALLTARLITFLPMLTTVGPCFLRVSIPSLISQYLAGDTHTEQANRGQTPDARFHDVPHSG